MHHYMVASAGARMLTGTTSSIPPHVMGQVRRAFRKQRRARRQYRRQLHFVEKPDGVYLAPCDRRRAKKWNRAVTRWGRGMQIMDKECDMWCQNLYRKISQCLYQRLSQ